MTSRSDTPTYWIKTDIDNEPMNLLRVVNHRVEVWHRSKWQATASEPEALDGLGGDQPTTDAPGSRTPTGSFQGSR